MAHSWRKLRTSTDILHTTLNGLAFIVTNLRFLDVATDKEPGVLC